jgi:hypothetical protein
MAVGGAAERLEGLQYICINLSFAEIAKRGPNANINELHSPFHFLSVTLGEYAKTARRGRKTAAATAEDRTNPKFQPVFPPECCHLPRRVPRPLKKRLYPDTTR